MDFLSESPTLMDREGYVVVVGGGGGGGVV